jgi:hypothetical protein
VLRLATSEDGPHQQAAAAALATGASVSHGTLLRLRSLRGFTSFDEAHVCTDPSRRVEIQGVTVHRRKGIAPFLEWWHGIPVTSVALAIVDAGFDADPLRIRSAYHDAWHRGLLVPRDLLAVVQALAAPGRPGIPHARDLLDRYGLDTNPARSIDEIRLFDAIVDAGLPVPVLNHRVVRPGGGPAFIDLAFPSLQYGIEIDHTFTHGESTRADDLRRHGDITMAGWFLDHVMEEHLAEQSLPRVVATVERQLSRLGA